MPQKLKTTAGPWKVGLNGDGNLAIFTESTAVRSLVAGFKAGTVREADARLMAAAPQMRQAIVDLRAEIDEMVRRVGWSGGGARARADLLIADLDAE